MKKGTHKQDGSVVAVKIIEKNAASEELTLLQRYERSLRRSDGMEWLVAVIVAIR